MNTEGFIKIYRKIQENRFYKNSEAIHLWIHLLFSASYEDNIFYYNNIKINLKRGQLITGRKKLAYETGIKESKIYRLLKLYENEHQIEQQTTSKYSIITIVSYDDYNPIKQQENNKRTTNEQQMNTTKEIKEIKENKLFIIPKLEDVEEYCKKRNNNISAQYFIDYYTSKGWMIGKNKMKDWKAAIRTWENRNKKEQKIEENISRYKIIEG